MSKRPILSRQATPPEPRHPLPWLAASLVFAIIAIAFARSDLSAAAALTVCAVLSGLMTYDAQRYNRADLPRLVEYWHRAFMCNRCGEVFVPA